MRHSAATGRTGVVTAHPLTFDFPLMSPPVDRPGLPPLRLSLRPPWRVPADERLLELLAERDRRRGAYPKLVRDGRMTADDADRHQAILARIAEDFADRPIGQSGAAWLRWNEEWLSHFDAAPWRWADKVRELRRELALRRNTYPKWIAARRVDEGEARERMERLEAVHWRYWICLEWFATAGEGTLGQRLDPVRRQAALVDAWLWRAHCAADPALAGYLTPEQIAWHQAREQEQAA